MAGYNVLEYVEHIEGQTFPPLLVEVLLKSGRSYYIKNAFRPSRDLEMIGLRVWDLRATDVSALPEKLNAAADRDAWEDFASIDPALDQANLWVHSAEVEGFMEWHERYWPLAAPDEGQQRIGFTEPSE